MRAMVYDWLAVGCFFKPYAFTAVNDEGKVGCQILMATAVMDSGIVPLDGGKQASREPGPFRSEELAGFVESIMASHGRPLVGIMFMAEVWMGTEALFSMPAIANRVRFLKQVKESWPEMAAGDRLSLEQWRRTLSLDLQWAVSERPDLN